MAEINSNGWSVSKYYQSLDAQAVLSFLVYSDLSTALGFKADRFIQEELIIDGYIRPLFDGFNQISDFWDDLISKVKRYIVDFDSIEPPPFDTFADTELFWLDADGVVSTESGSLNVRLDGSKDGKIIGKLEKGSKVIVLGTSADGKWYQVKYLDESGQEQTGYVSKDYVSTTKVFGQSTTETSTEEAAPVSTPSTSREFSVNTEKDNLNVRDANGNKIDSLPKGTKVKFLGVNGDKTQIEYVDANGQKQTGYVATQYLKEVPNPTPTPQDAVNPIETATAGVATATATEATVTENSNAVTDSNVQGVQSGSSTQNITDTTQTNATSESTLTGAQTSLGNQSTEGTQSNATTSTSVSSTASSEVGGNTTAQTTGSTSTATGTAASTRPEPQPTVTDTPRTWYVNTEKGNLNLRDSSGKVIGNVEKGGTLTRLESQPTANGYIKVRTADGREGFVKETYTSSVNPNNVSSSSADVQPKTMTVSNFQDPNSHLNFRSLPSTSSGKVIGSFKLGDTINVVDSDRSDGWVEVVTSDGTHGFVSKDYLK